jgi:hypothetical protein
MRIQIGTGAITDISTYGFYLAKSPGELGCDVKESNIVTTDFPEESGQRFYISTAPAKKSFDYTISLLYYEKSLNTANAKITSFYESLLGKQITIYDDQKKKKVVGYMKSYKAGEFYRNEVDAILFDLTFFVPRPQDCDFNLTT